MWWEPVQTTIEQSVLLADVTFVVVDLETTGGSPAEAAITEIGAVKLQAGEVLGEFQTLVDPGQPIPPYVAHLTGIDDRLVAGSPSIAQVLPSYLEFARGAVFVAHNASFDRAFLDASLVRDERPPVPGPVVCTAKLARRVVWPDVPNVRLATLARYFRTRVQPTHRALTDARATAEVLDGLIELGGRLGIHTLGELLHACSARGRPNFGKIRLAEDLTPGPGVYLFRGRDGRVLYVGKSTSVRERVKSYFYGDTRKKVQDLLAAVVAIEALPTPGGEAEALALEARLITVHEPPYNRRGKRWRSAAYLTLDRTEAWPRLKVSRAAGPHVVLGPFPNQARARLAKEALEEAVAIRRCTRAMGRTTRFSACALADMGRCLAPCEGRTDPDAYAALAATLADAIHRPDALLRRLVRRIDDLAAAERFEEAALARDRLRVLVEALWRVRVDAWLTAGELVVLAPGGQTVTLRGGAVASRHDEAAPIGWPAAPARAEELAAVRAWIARHRPRVAAATVAPSEPVLGGAAIAALRARLARAQQAPDAPRSRAA
ncbi:MAG TPA: DEDD exonuclease domain-containing protein [Actinomycetota bacterium]|nr:DEDD exonuclease domain-containing protein [Actinomycetota bacterium]